MSLIAILTGIFRKFIIFTVIILIHEVGHFVTGLILGWKVDRIYIYPYGGCTKFNDNLNKPLKEETVILLMGPIIQIMFYFLVINHLGYYDGLIFKDYNIIILIFNLLPIYPLDGGKLLNIIFNITFPYKMGINLSLIISVIFISIVFFFTNSLIFFLVLILLLLKIIEEYNKKEYYYNKFLLERYLYNFSLKKRKIIQSVNSFYRDKKHVVKYDNQYLTEKEVLKKYFRQ